MLRRWASETLSYQREVDKGKLTAVASFEKLTFPASVSPSSEQKSLLRRRAHAQNVSFSKLAIAVNLPLSTSR